MAARRYVSPYELAVVHLALGNVDHALGLLHEAADTRVFDVTSARSDPRLDPLRGNEEFAQVTAKLCL